MVMLAAMTTNKPVGGIRGVLPDGMPLLRKMRREIIRYYNQRLLLRKTIEVMKQAEEEIEEISPRMTLLNHRLLIERVLRGGG
jgi:hypothetical protein